MSILQYIQENGTDEGYTGKVMQFNEYLKFIGVDEYKTLISKYL